VTGSATLKHCSDPAVHKKYAPVHELRLWRSYERDRRGDVFSAAAPPHGAAFDVALNLLRIGFIPLSRNVRGNIAGSDSVDRDAMRPRCRGDRTYNHIDAGLRRRIVNLRGRSEFA
jgi:hypothetical protein